MSTRRVSRRRLAAKLLIAATAVLALTACTVRYLPSSYPRPNIAVLTPGIHACLEGRLGVTVNENLFVIRVLSGGPAWQAGIQHGDRVVAVNGQRVFTIAQAQYHAAGLPGTVASVTVQRPGETRSRIFTMLRACLR
jgi:S1-C subfamily serine protease